MTTQKMYIDELKKIAEKKKLTFSMERNFSNAGTIYFRKKFTTVSALEFSFQRDYFTLSYSMQKPQSYFVNNQVGRNFIAYIKNHEGEKIEQSLKGIRFSL